MWNSLFVFVGAALWASDTLFRQPLTESLSAVTIVYYEHVFATIFSFIWLISTARKDIFPGFKQWSGALFIGVFGSAVATILFTESFRYVNPSVSILLQKVQPIVVILLSGLFLGEKISKSFLVWAALALGSAFFLSFPNGIKVGMLFSNTNVGSILAVSAAILWAVSTVVGKGALQHAKESTLSFWRFFFGLAAMMLISSKFSQAKIEIPFVLSNTSVLTSISLMALIPGFLAVTLYYRGLKKVPASAATLLELSFPLTAIWINSHFLGFHLSSVQVFSAGVLLVSMVGVSLSTPSK
jgi:drug/metabolite transporter (DMT)-like permease